MSALTLGGDKHAMPPRPGYGTEGQPIVVYANYVQIIPPRDLTLYVYDVSEVKPEVAGKKCTQVLRLMVNESPELADYRDHVVTDFRSTLISRKKLDLKPEKGQQDPIIPVTYKAEGEDDPKERAPLYKVRVRHTKTLTVGDLMDYLTSTNPAKLYDNKLEMIRKHPWGFPLPRHSRSSRRGSETHKADM